MSLSEYDTKLRIFFDELSSEFHKNELSYQKHMADFFDKLSFKIEVFSQFKKQADRYLSTDFNVFDIISPDENKFSDIIANLLDRYGTHGQGKLFADEFILFLRKNGLQIPCDDYTLTFPYDDFSLYTCGFPAHTL